MTYVKKPHLFMVRFIETNAKLTSFLFMIKNMTLFQNLKRTLVDMLAQKNERILVAKVIYLIS